MGAAHQKHRSVRKHGPQRGARSQNSHTTICVCILHGQGDERGRVFRTFGTTRQYPASDPRAIWTHSTSSMPHSIGLAPKCLSQSHIATIPSCPPDEAEVPVCPQTKARAISKIQVPLDFTHFSFQTQEASRWSCEFCPHQILLPVPNVIRSLCAVTSSVTWDCSGACPLFVVKEGTATCERC